VASTVNDLSPVKKELSIELSSDEVKQAVDKAYGQLSREARVRGFRRGKAPRGVLRRMYGKAVLSEVRGELVAQAFVAALKEHDIDPISEPEIDAGDLVEGQGYAFKVTIETTPRLEAVELEGVELERYRVEVAPELVEAELTRLQSSMATARDLDEPRPVAVGDLVRIHVQRWEEGEWRAGESPEQEIVLEQGSLPDELVTALDGAAVDEEKVVELESRGPGDERNRLLVRVLGIRARQLPEIDDEFAKDVGDFEDLGALKGDIEQRLKEMLESNENERLRHALFTQVREQNPLELPKGLVERQTEAMKAQFQGVLDSAEKPEDGDDEGRLKRLDDGANDAARSVIHHHLLLREMARLWEVEVADDEVEEELKIVAERAGLPLPMVRAEYGKGPRIDELRNNLLERKVFDLALGKVKIKEVEPPKRGDDKEE
jgi:trigger factor